MNGPDAPYVVFLLLAIVLPLAALLNRRIALGQAAKMGLAWVAIFGVMFAAFSFRSEFRAFGNRLYASAFGEPVALANGEMRIDMAEDGHFWVRGRVNGTNVHFLVDSGATVTTLSAGTAAVAGVQPTNRRSVVETANGRAIVSQAFADVAVGSIERRDFPVNVSDSDETDILGMNFLSSLNAWRVEGGDLVLRP